VTYGENGGRVRAELAVLLRQHRIQQRLGGQGIHSVPESTTVEQRRELGQLIQRCRAAAIRWCLHAVTAAGPGDPGGSFAWPGENLQRRLQHSINESAAGPLSMDDLSTKQEFAMVETWRQVATAAVLGEHDFPGLMDRGRLSVDQRATVLSDAAEVARALVVLDVRYKNIPGWIPIADRGNLARAAQSCVRLGESAEMDYSVDHKGWRPPVATIDGGPMSGIAGVLQAEHTALVYLAQFPDALNFRRVLDGQRIVSHEAARLARVAAPELAEGWLEREQTYRRLVVETRNLAGLVGNGGLAAAESANAVGRLRRLRIDDISSRDPLQDLDKLFVRTDARLASIVEQGADEHLYFLSVKVPRIVDGTGLLVSPTRERYLPINSPIQTDLLAITRLQLRPATVAPAFPLVRTRAGTNCGSR
jgi:hypothetical protein